MTMPSPDLLMSDLRFALRMLRRSPVYAAVVVIVVALGCGAVATVFSAMNAIVLRALPGVADPARLVSVRPILQDGSRAEQGSYAYYAALREQTRTLGGIAAWGRVALTISAGSEGIPAGGNLVSAEYFEMLGVRPALGRFFTSEEHVTPRAHPVLVVSHRFWVARLGADPSAIGRTVLVNGTPFTLVGVAPESFRGIYTGLVVDAWAPLMMQPVLRPRSNLTAGSWLWMFGRLNGGIEPGTAERELSALTVNTQSVAPHRFTGASVAPLTGLPGGEGRLLLGFMALLLGAAGLVLVIAGVNVAAMLSARSLARQREMAVRAALGAGRARLLRQLLTEILLLFLLGGAGGIVFATLAAASLERLPLPVNVPIALELSPDWRVFVFALVTALAAGLTFGLAPALQGARRDITARLREDAYSAGPRRAFVSRTLIVGQLALSLVLLVAAGLFMRALTRGERVDPGFDPSRVLTAALEPESWGYDSAKARAFYGALRQRLEGAPGVTGVSFAGRLPLMMSSSVENIIVDGREITINTSSVDADYFDVLRLPLVSGRGIEIADHQSSLKVTVINETMARRLWPDGTALGRAFQFRGGRLTVVGIARDAKYARLDEETPLFAYLPLSQWWQPTQSLLVRTAGAPEALAAAVQQAMASLDGALPRPGTTTLEQATAIVLFPQRVAAIVTGVLGGVGLLLATVGLYGVTAYSMSRRTREIGIRVALGADRSTILGMVLREGSMLAGAGVMIGVVLAAGVTRLMGRFLFGVSPLDAVTFAGMSLLFLAVAIAATYLPGRRAASSDPMIALRM